MVKNSEMAAKAIRPNVAEAGSEKIAIHSVGGDASSARRISRAVLKAASAGVLAAAFMAAMPHGQAHAAGLPNENLMIDGDSPPGVNMMGVAGGFVPGAGRSAPVVDPGAPVGVLITDLTPQQGFSSESSRVHSAEECQTKGIALAGEIANDSSHRAHAPIMQVICYDRSGTVLGEARVTAPDGADRPIVGAATGVFSGLNTVTYRTADGEAR